MTLTLDQIKNAKETILHQTILRTSNEKLSLQKTVIDAMPDDEIDLLVN